MKNIFLLLSLLFAVPCYGAACSSSQEDLEGWLYALHNPSDDVTVRVDMSGIAHKKRVSFELIHEATTTVSEFRGNHFYINRVLRFGPISVHLAGGFPKGSFNQHVYDYLPAQKFIILQRKQDVTHILEEIEDIELQKLKNVTAVLQAVSHRHTPIIIFNLAVWMNIAYAGFEAADLPVCYVPKKIPFFSCTLDRYTARVLTQKEWEQHLAHQTAYCLLQ